MAMRSIRNVAADSRATAQERRLFYWSSLWRWVERAQAYDAERDRITRLSNEAARREMDERHIKFALMSQNVVLERLKAFSANPPAGITLPETMLSLERAVKIERLARGVPTEQVAVTGRDGEPVDLLTSINRLREAHGLQPKEAADLAGPGDGPAEDQEGA